MLRLHTTPSYTYFGLRALSTDKLKKLDKILSFLVEGAWFSPAYKKHGWDGRIRLLGKVYKNKKPVAYRFPTGLVHDARGVFGPVELVYRYELTEDFEIPDREALENYIYDACGFKLHDFQCFAIENMLKRRRGTVMLPTGSGKTPIASVVLDILNLPSIVMVPGLDLLYQTRTKYAQYLGIDEDALGIIGEGQYEPKKITVASVPTLRNMVQIKRGGRVCFSTEEAEALFKRIKVVISDEAHMVGNNTFFEVLMSFINAEFRYGMSATPFDRSDGNTLMLIGATGPLIAKVKPALLMKRKILATPEITIFRITGPRISGAIQWQRAYHQGIVDHAARNAKIIDLVKQHKGEKVLVIFSRIAHGKTLSSLLNAEGVDHELLYGKDPGKVREQVRRTFEDGELSVILASMIFKLGVDLPAIKVLIRADGGKSTISTVQILGRALRVKDGDTKIKLYDFFDQHQKFLAKHSRQRLKDYLALGDPVVINQTDLETGQKFIAF